MSYTTDYYKSLVTSEHQQSPKYLAFLEAMIEPITVIQSVTENLVFDFNVDTAIGVQLDIVGKWVGVTRFLPEEITDVYLTFDTENLGFDRGVFKGPFDPDTGLSRMPDYIYRIMIKFKILANKWDGTIPTAYADFKTIFNNEAFISMVDHQDMSMSVIIVGLDLGPLGIGLLKQGYFPFRPEGVKIKEFILDPLGGKILAFDVDNDLFSGFDVGHFPVTITP